jgi:hypothetical protein
LLPPKEAARLLGLSPGTLAKWRVYGRAPQFVKVGSRVFYELPVLQAYIAQNTRGSTSAPPRTEIAPR